MKILIIGDAQSGKDTLAELIQERTELTYTSSSRAALDIFLYDLLSEIFGYTSKEEAYRDRVNHRHVWEMGIRAFNYEDPAKLCKRILQQHNIYTGMRSRTELKACRHLFDLVLWVDRNTGEDASNKLRPSDADFIVDNNGTLDDLKQRLPDIIELINSFSHASIQQTLF